MQKCITERHASVCCHRICTAGQPVHHSCLHLIASPQFSGIQHWVSYWHHRLPLADPQHLPAGLLPVQLPPPHTPEYHAQSTELIQLVKVGCHRDSNSELPAELHPDKRCRITSAWIVLQAVLLCLWYLHLYQVTLSIDRGLVFTTSLFLLYS